MNAGHYSIERETSNMNHNDYYHPYSQSKVGEPSNFLFEDQHAGGIYID